jgi:hypothetical protein
MPRPWRILTCIAAVAALLPLAACDFTAEVECSTDSAGVIRCTGTGEGRGNPVPPVPPSPAPPTSSAPTPTTPPSTTTGAPAPTTSAAPPPPPTSSAPPATTTAPTTTAAPPTSSPPPPAAEATAAARLGWGASIGGDEFNGTRLDTSKWGVYNGPGHAGNGLRRPSQITVADGKLTITGTANGTSGGMAWQANTVEQRWEARIRIPRKGDAAYSAVFLLWVQNNRDFPCKGEIDPFEHRTSTDRFGSFLHYSCANRQTQTHTAFNPQEWNHIAVERSRTAVTYWLNGEQVFRDADPAHQPVGPYHPTFQLDLMESRSSLIPSSMEVDWIRQYAP